MREKLDDFAELLEHGTTTPYPLIAAALKQLQKAVDTELKTVRRTALPTRPRDNRGLKRRGTWARPGNTTNGRYA